GHVRPLTPCARASDAAAPRPGHAPRLGRHPCLTRRCRPSTACFPHAPAGRARRRTGAYAVDLVVHQTSEEPEKGRHMDGPEAMAPERRGSGARPRMAPGIVPG